MTLLLSLPLLEQLNLIICSSMWNMQVAIK